MENINIIKASLCIGLLSLVSSYETHEVRGRDNIVYSGYGNRGRGSNNRFSGIDNHVNGNKNKFVGDINEVIGD